MAASLPRTECFPATTTEEESARALHDVANLLTSMLVASSTAAEDIDVARRSGPLPPAVGSLLDSVQESLLLLENAGRLARHVLGSRTYARSKKLPGNRCFGSDALVDLPAVLDLAARVARPILESRVKIHIEPSVVSNVVGHDSELSIVFFNLFLNAYQAISDDAARAGSIDVSLHQSADRVCVQIRDSGPGMDGEQLSNAFQAGYSSRGGRGLGLTICREIVERYGGRIKLANAKGLVVRVFLRAPDPAEADR